MTRVVRPQDSAISAEMLRRSDAANAFSTGIVSTTSLHLLANSPAEQMIEWAMAGSPLTTSLVTPALTLVDGYVHVPTRPGLGVALDWEVVTRYRGG